MERQKFYEKVQKRVTERLGDCYEVSLQKVFKTNVSLTSITIFEKGAKNRITPSIYLDRYYQDEIDVDICAEEIIRTYEENAHSTPMDISMLLDFNRVRDKIMCKIINTEYNRELLEDTPNKKFLDLSIVFYVLIEEISTQKTSAIMPIKSHFLDLWNISIEELFEIAYKNTISILGIELKGMCSVMAELLENGIRKKCIEADDLFKVLDMMCDDTDSNMYVLKGSGSEVNAAVLMIYTDIFKHFCIKHKIDEVVIIPSSVHELLLIIDKTKAYERYNEMVRDVNGNVLVKEDVLSEHCYLYRLASDSIIMV